MPIDMPPPAMGNLQGFQVAPPQTQDPLQTLAQMGQLRTQALQQQQASLGIQQQAMQFRSNQAMMRAFAQGGGDWDATQKLLDSSPDILPSDRMAVEQHRLQLQQSAAALTKEEQGIYATNADRYRGFLEGVQNQDDLNQANINAARAGVGFVDPNQLGGASQGVPQLTTFTDVPHVQAFINSLALHTQLQEEQLKKAQAGESQAKGVQATAEARKASAEAGMSEFKLSMLRNLMRDPVALNNLADQQVPPAQFPDANRALKNQLQVLTDPDKIGEAFQHYADPVVQAELDKVKIPIGAAQAGANIRATEPVRVAGALSQASGEAALAVPGLGGAAPAAGAPAAPAAGGAPAGPGMTTLPGEPIVHPGAQAPAPTPGAAPLTGEAYLATLPKITADQIRAIAEGRATIDSIGRSPIARGRLQQAVMQYDPTWSEQRAALRNAFTTGPDAANIGNLNTAAVHAQQFLEAAKAMDAHFFRPGNAVFNWFRQQFGSATPSNLEGIKAAWAGEMASALKGNATEGEIERIDAAIHAASSMQQFQGIVNENLKILGAKLNTYHERAQQQNLGNWSPVLPAARDVFRQHGMDPAAPAKTGNAWAGQGGNTPSAGYKVGDIVMYNSERHKIVGFNPKTGKPLIDPRPEK